MKKVFVLVSVLVLVVAVCNAMAAPDTLLLRVYSDSSTYLAGDYISIALLLLASFFLLVSFLSAYDRVSALKQEDEPHFMTLLAILVFAVIVILIGAVPILSGWI